MDIKQLRYLLGVLKARSFTKAAETLHVAQPAIGMQVRKLEDELGVKLLTRHSRGIMPTEAGELLARDAALVIGEIERMRDDIMGMGREPRGRIALGMTGTAVRMFGTRLVETYRRDYPELDLTVTEGESHWLADWLAQGRLDVAVTCDPPANSGAVSEALATEALYFVAPPGHALAEGPDIALRAVLDADLVLPPQPSMVRRQMADAARLNGAELRSVFEVESVTMTKDLVRLGMACTVMPYGAARQEVEDGRLAALRIVDPHLTLTLYLTCSESRPGTRALEAVRSEIRALAAGLVESGAAGWASCAGVPERVTRGSGCPSDGGSATRE